MAIAERVRWFIRLQRLSWRRLFGAKPTSVGEEPFDLPGQDCSCDERMQTHTVAEGNFDDITGHFHDCEWAKQMCMSCKGRGYCSTCHGDGTTSPGPHDHPQCECGHARGDVAECEHCDCRLVYTCEYLGAYVDGEIPPACRDAFRMHIASCAKCQGNLEIAMQLSTSTSR